MRSLRQSALEQPVPVPSSRRALEANRSRREVAAPGGSPTFFPDPEVFSAGRGIDVLVERRPVTDSHISYNGLAISLLWRYRRAILTHWLTFAVLLFLVATAWQWAHAHHVYGFFPILWYTLTDIYTRFEEVKAMKGLTIVLTVIAVLFAIFCLQRERDHREMLAQQAAQEAYRAQLNAPSSWDASKDTGRDTQVPGADPQEFRKLQRQRWTRDEHGNLRMYYLPENTK
jgi:hypothetical protein